jgi:hypothetical protein
LITKLRDGDELTSRRYELHVDTDSKVSLLYKKEQRPGHPVRYRLCVPPNLRAFILRRYHTLPVSGHKGRDKTVAAIARLYFWPDLVRDVAHWLKRAQRASRARYQDHCTMLHPLSSRKHHDHGNRYLSIWSLQARHQNQ